MILDDDLVPIDCEADAVDRLRTHWASVFDKREISAEAALQLFPHVQKAPNVLNWILDRSTFRELVMKPRDCSPGLDGVPYAVWSVGGDEVIDVLHSVCQRLLDERQGQGKVPD